MSTELCPQRGVAECTESEATLYHCHSERSEQLVSVDDVTIGERNGGSVNRQPHPPSTSPTSPPPYLSLSLSRSLSLSLSLSVYLSLSLSLSLSPLQRSVRSTVLTCTQRTQARQAQTSRGWSARWSEAGGRPFIDDESR